MRISSISNSFNIRTNNLKNLIAFKNIDALKSSKNDNFETQGTKVYYDSKGKVIDPSKITYKNGEVYVDGKKPSSYSMHQYNHQTKQTREVSYFNGTIFTDRRYENGKLIREDIYGHNTNQRAIVVKYHKDGSFDYNIARNFRFDTKNTPAFVLRQSKDKTNYNVFASLNKSEETPLILSVETTGTLGTQKARLTTNKKGEYSYIAPTKESLEALQKGLIELKKIILSDDMKADFGQYKKFNEELEKALAFIEKELE